MPRTTGAVNILTRVDLGNTRWYFPTVFLGDMERLGLPQDQIQEVVVHWIRAMEAKGYTPDKLKAIKATITSNAASQRCISDAITTVRASRSAVAQALGAATPAESEAEEDEDDDESMASFSIGTLGPNETSENQDPHAAQQPPQAGTTTETGTIDTTGSGPVFTEVSESTSIASIPGEPRSFDDRLKRRKHKFQTDEEFYFGVPRNIPKDPQAPRMHGVYINGDNPAIDRIYARGKYALLFEGPTACGKTEKAKHLAYEVGSRAVIVGHDAHTEVEDILGKVMPTGNPDHPYAFVDGPLTQAMEFGWTYIADEINAVKAQVLMVYNQINNGEDLLVRTDAGVRIVKRHPLFRFIGTMNPPTQYAGTHEMNLAQLRRFCKFNFDYMPKDKEVTILSANYRTMQIETLEQIVDFANEVRAKQKNDPENTRYTIGLATLLKVCDLVSECDISLREAIDIAVLNEVAGIDQEEYDAVRITVESTFPYVDTNDNQDPISNNGLTVV